MKLRKLFTIIICFILSFTLVSCTKKTDDDTVNYTNPAITEADKVITSGTNNGYDFKVTKQDVYDTIRNYGGVPLLLQDIDYQLMKPYMSQITTSSPLYISRYNRLVYSTSDEAAINLLTSEEKAKDLKDYKNTMLIMGYDTIEKEEDYIKFLAAKDLYTIEFLNKEQENKKSDYFYSSSTLETYYNDNYYKNAKALVINFTSINDYRSSIKSLGLVIYNSELRVYTGSEDLATLSERNLSIDNTRTFTDSLEALNYFVQLYNIVYGSYRTAQTITSIYTDPDFDYTFSILNTNASALSSKLFSMSKDEYTYSAYKSSATYGTAYSLIYRLDGETRTEYSALSNEDKAKVLAAYIGKQVETASNVTAAFASLRSENNIKFYDRYFAYTYAKSYDTSYDATKMSGDASKLVTCGNITVTADDFYNYAYDLDPKYYTLNASIISIEETIKTFSLLYGDERDLSKNASLRYITYYDTVKSSISSNYKEETYESEEKYLYATFGLSSLKDTIKYYYVMNDLKTVTVYDLIMKIDPTDINGHIFTDKADTYATKILDEYYNNYYDLYPYQIDVTVDYNGDFINDDLTYVMDNLLSYGITLTKAEYEAKLNNLYTIIKDIADKADTVSDLTTDLTDFITSYNNSSRIDGTYKEYKNLGFRLSYNAVTTTVSSTTTSPTYYNYHSTATEVMNKAYLDVYNKIIDSTYNDIFTYGDKLYVDEAGAHFIAATKGKGGKVKPTFSYNEKSDTKSEYNDFANNESSAPTMSQLSNRFYVYFYVTILDDKDIALDTYNISSFPALYPSAVNLDDYMTALSDYFFSDNFVNAYYANVLGYSDLQAVYLYFLEENV